MAHIDALIDKISDPALRQAMRDQVAIILDKQDFGLVYQTHKPETVQLPHYKVRRGCKVRIISENDEEMYRVESVSGNLATIVSLNEVPEQWDVETFDLVVVREFGEPIYPGLKSVGRLDAGGDKPAHVVINAENFHALETLLYTHLNKVDAIYIDPPYNSGARDWTYNNDYVEPTDIYRHSKWLSFMERRLVIGRQLLKADGVMVVTIDEHEVSHLGVLLQQLFKDASDITLVTIVNNTKGVTRAGVRRFSRVDEYAYFCFFGSAGIYSIGDDMLTTESKASEAVDELVDEFDSSGVEEPEGDDSDDAQEEPKVTGPGWRKLLRSGDDSRRADRKDMFYPIWIDGRTRRVVEVGEPLAFDKTPSFGKDTDGRLPVWPVRQDGTSGRWGVGAPALRGLAERGFLKIGRFDKRRKTWAVSYLTRQIVLDVDAGKYVVTDRDSVTGVATVVDTEEADRKIKTVWFRKKHNAGVGGTAFVSALVGADRPFAFPKSVYAVRDTVAMLTAGKPDAVIADFFAGSGTTLHATAMLNAEDGGSRQSILVTNNEVDSKMQDSLRSDGFHPGDPEWEERGIFYRATKPRVEATVTGKRTDGSLVPEKLRNANGTLMSAGLEENVEFFELSYEDPNLVSLGRKFHAIAPLLWLKAGAVGACIARAEAKWSLPDDAVYGILFDADEWREFADAIAARDQKLTHVFIVTDSEATFQQIIRELPGRLGTTQLYSDYLHTFEINTTGRA